MFPFPFPVMPVMRSQDLLAARAAQPVPPLNPQFHMTGNTGSPYPQRNDRNNNNNTGRGRGGRGGGRGAGQGPRNNHNQSQNFNGASSYIHHNNHANGLSNQQQSQMSTPKFQHKRPEQFQLPPKNSNIVIPTTQHNNISNNHQNQSSTASSTKSAVAALAAGPLGGLAHLASPFITSAPTQHLSPLTAPAGPFMAFQFVPMSPTSPLTIGGAFGTVSSVPPARTMLAMPTPLLVPMPMPQVDVKAAPVITTSPPVEVPDFDLDMFRLRELKLVELIKEWMDNIKNNPKQGSMPSERVQNCIKSLYPQLYASVIGSEYANQWHRFVRTHPERFEIVYPAGEGRCLPRIRLLTHNAWENADREEMEERKAKELWVVQCLQYFLEQSPSHEANIEDFIREFPKIAPVLETLSPTTIPSAASPKSRTSSLPRFRDIVRLIKRYKDTFIFMPSATAGTAPRVRLVPSTPAEESGAQRISEAEEPLSVESPGRMDSNYNGFSPPKVPLTSVPRNNTATANTTAPAKKLTMAPALNTDSGLAPLRAPSPVSMMECMLPIEPMTMMPGMPASPKAPISPTTAPAAFASWGLVQTWGRGTPLAVPMVPSPMWGGHSPTASPTAASRPQHSPSHQAREVAIAKAASPVAVVKKQHQSQTQLPLSPAVSAAPPQTPQTQTSMSSVSTPLQGLGMVPDSDPHLMPLRELKLKNIVVQFLENGTTNPKKGSVPSERVQNCVKAQHADLYKSVVGAGFGNQWHRFVAKYDDVFHLFSVQEYARTIWRIRLVSHAEWENADEVERILKRIREQHYMNCLLQYLQCKDSHQCTMDEFLGTYPHLVQNREWARNPPHSDQPSPPPLPARGDFARFVRRHWDNFNYDSKSFTITLISPRELERVPEVIADIRRREDALASPNTSPTATPLSLLSARSPPTSALSGSDNGNTPKWERPRNSGVPLRCW